jgi:hypothetical protein
MMTDDYFENWVTSVRATLAEMAEMDWGYPIHTNEVRERSAERHVVPPSLEPLYEVCDGASLMNVYVGYDIHPSWMVEAAAQRGLPTRIKGKSPRAIHVFGSDGGGCMFALGTEDGAVYFLPNEALIEGGVYEEDEDMPVCRLAGSVVEFLDRLKADIEAFVRGDEDHPFMAHWERFYPLEGDASG